MQCKFAQEWKKHIEKFQKKNLPRTCRCQKKDVFLKNQSDALIIAILFCYKTLHVSGIFSADHQEFSTIHSALENFMQVFDDRFQAESGWSYSP